MKKILTIISIVIFATIWGAILIVLLNDHNKNYEDRTISSNILNPSFQRALRVRRSGDTQMFNANAVLLSKDKVLTNNHVCEHLSENLEVVDFKGRVLAIKRRLFPIKPVVDSDLCVVEIEAENFDLEKIKIKTDLKNDTRVIKIGYTFNYQLSEERYFLFSISFGTVRTVIDFNPFGNEKKIDILDPHVKHIYRTDIEIVPGDSGTGIYDESGNLVALAFARDLNNFQGLLVRGIDIANLLEATETAFERAN